jgi:hypothetical protein
MFRLILSIDVELITDVLYVVVRGLLDLAVRKTSLEKSRVFLSAGPVS